MTDHDLLTKKLAQAIVDRAHEHGQVRWHLPEPPDNPRVIEKHEVDISKIRSSAEVVEVNTTDNGSLQIGVSSVSTQRLPYKYHRGDRHNPPDVERANREVFADYVAIFEDGLFEASGTIEV